MTTDVPIEDHAPYSDHGWSSELPPSGHSLFNRGRKHLDILIQETTRALVDGYNGIQATTTRCLRRAATGAATPAELVEFESQPPNHAHQKQDMDSVGEPDTTPGDTLRSHANPFAREADDPEDASRLTTLRDNHSYETGLIQSNRSWTLVVRLIVVVLLLIMAPGLIVGMVTRHVAWGIAISGTCAPAVVFFGGLYYHHNR